MTRNRISDYFSNGSPEMRAATQDVRNAIRQRLQEISNQAILDLGDDAKMFIAEFPSLRNDFTKTGIFVGKSCVMVIHRSGRN